MRNVRKKNIILSFLSGTMIAAGGCAMGLGHMYGKALDEKKKLSDKHLALFLMMNQWVKVKQEGKSLREFFEKKGYKKIAIYGMSYAGETLVRELESTDIEIAYGIDKNADSLYMNIDIVSLDEDLEKVDVVVVTAITFFDEIQEALCKKLDCPIISLEDILYEV